MGAAWRMIAVVVVFALALGGIIYERMQLLDSGREVTLAIQPVDPTDFFRGDYVMLEYGNLSRMELAGASDWERARNGDPVYVALDVGPNGRAVPKSVHATLAKAREASPVVMRGTIVWAYGNRETDRATTMELRITYGIEAYFVPQGEGRALEQARNARRLEMLIAVGDDGEAAIKGLILDGKRAYVEGLF